jgi:hypothetical protein
MAMVLCEGIKAIPMKETPKEAKKDKLIIDEEKIIHIDAPFSFADAELLSMLKMAWLDTAMKGILPPSIYSDMHSDRAARRAAAKLYLDREGVAFKETNQCAFITVKDKIVARFDSPWRMKNGSKKR